MSLLLARAARNHRGVVLVSRPYRDAVLQDLPAGYWRLDETSGVTAHDASGNARAGNFRQGSANIDASLLTAAGLLDSESNLGILIPNIATGVYLSSCPILTGQNWSCEAIIKPTSAPPQEGVGAIWQLGAGGNGCPEIDVVDNGSGKYKFRVMTSGVAVRFTSATVLPYNTRAHVLLTYNATTHVLKLYVNGSLDANGATFTYGNFAGETRLGFAAFSSIKYPCQGYLDEAALYQSELSAARALAHYQAMLAA